MAAGSHDATAWTKTQLGLVPKRPSWLAAPSPPALTTRGPDSVRPPTRLSVVPRPRLTSMPPPPPSAGARIDVIAAMDADMQRRDDELRAMAAEVEVLRTTAADLAESLATARRRLLEASEGELVSLALTIASRVVGRVIDEDPAQIAEWAREAIATMPARETMVVAISSDLAERVRPEAWEQVTGGAHRLEVDAALPAGTCEIRAGAASVEVSAAARLGAVGEAIGAIS